MARKAKPHAPTIDSPQVTRVGDRIVVELTVEDARDLADFLDQFDDWTDSVPDQLTARLDAVLTEERRQ